MAALKLKKLETEIARLRNALMAIYDKYIVASESTTVIAGTLAYMAKDAITPPNDQASGARSVPLDAPVGRGKD